MATKNLDFEKELLITKIYNILGENGRIYTVTQDLYEMLEEDARRGNLTSAAYMRKVRSIDPSELRSLTVEELGCIESNLQRHYRSGCTVIIPKSTPIDFDRLGNVVSESITKVKEAHRSGGLKAADAKMMVRIFKADAALETSKPRLLVDELDILPMPIPEAPESIGLTVGDWLKIRENAPLRPDEPYSKKIREQRKESEPDITKRDINGWLENQSNDEGTE